MSSTLPAEKIILFLRFTLSHQSGDEDRYPSKAIESEQDIDFEEGEMMTLPELEAFLLESTNQQLDVRVTEAGWSVSKIELLWDKFKLAELEKIRTRGVHPSDVELQ